METLTTCNPSTLAPYTPSGSNPWDAQKVKHLYRRLGYGATMAELTAALSITPGEAVQNMIDEAIATPNTFTPEWAFWAFGDYNDYPEENNQQRDDWYKEAARDLLNKGLKARLSFFWFNHFVAQIDVFQHAPYLFQYWDLLQTHSLGNFKTFVREIGIAPAMLLMLNGFENTSVSPNENYARELYELFTLGANNGYTQQDIIETSRALTGYNHWTDFGAAIFFEESTFDTTEKTIFGQTGNWGYDDVIDILFQEKAELIATFICTKLYNYFVSPAISEPIINELKDVFIASNWEIAPVLNLLFKSEHFFDENALSQIVKSPYDLNLTFIRETEMMSAGSEREFLALIIYLNGVLGQDFFQPIDVAGWQRDQDWINTSTLTGRWLGMDYISWQFWDYDSEQYRQFAINLTNNSNDPYLITTTIVDFFLSKPLHTTSEYDAATDVFKSEVPQGYYDDGSWNLSWNGASYQVILLIQHIFRMPEFQLK